MPKNSATPVAAIQPHNLTVHGHIRVDNYYWLREKSNIETSEAYYLEAGQMDC